MITLDTLYYRLYNYYGPQGWWPASSDIEMMIGAVLVQNTSWTNVKSTLQHFPTFDGYELLNTPTEMLMDWIRSAGFYTRKAATIQKLLTWYRNYDFNADNVSSKHTDFLREALLSLEGIGPETCDCILLYVFQRPVFIVDTYLKRLLLNSGHALPKKYHEIQRYCMERLPQNVVLFQEFHALVVISGKDLTNVSLNILDDAPTLQYTLKDLESLSHNPLMQNWIKTYGYIQRPTYPNPFWGTVYAIVGQLVSTASAHAIMTRFKARFPNEEAVINASIDMLREPGLTLAKARSIFEMSQKLKAGTFSFQTLYTMSPQEAVSSLSALRGIGVWSAKIILMHSYNVLDLESYDDIALRNAVKKQLRLDVITRDAFELFMKQFAPYRTIACLYLWASNSDKAR